MDYEPQNLPFTIRLRIIILSFIIAIFFITALVYALINNLPSRFIPIIAASLGLIALFLLFVVQLIEGLPKIKKQGIKIKL